MSEQIFGNQVWEIVKTLIPVFTFISGYLLGVLRDLLKSRRELRNIRSMLCTELKAKFKPANNEGKNVIYDSNIAGVVIEHLTTSPVYDAYLGQLSRLRAEETDKVYNTYFLFKVVGKDMQEKKMKEVTENKLLTETDADLIEQLIEHVFKSAAEALKLLEYYSKPWYRRWFRKSRRSAE